METQVVRSASARSLDETRSFVCIRTRLMRAHPKIIKESAISENVELRSYRDFLIDLALIIIANVKWLGLGEYAIIIRINGVDLEDYQIQFIDTMSPGTWEMGIGWCGGDEKESPSPTRR